MSPIIAQIDQVPDSFLKNALMVLIGTVTLTGAIIGIFGRGRRRIEPQPLQIETNGEVKTRKRKEYVTVEACTEHREGITDRLDTIEEDKNNLWNTMRSENTAIRKELNDSLSEMRAEMSRGFQDIERSLGRLEGKIDQR